MSRVRDALKAMMHRVQDSPLTVPSYYIIESYYIMRALTLGSANISSEDQGNVAENVTFIYKSFNRQRKARSLCRSIKRFYPSVKVVVADDSEVPLQLEGADVVHLPFNSGLSKGLIAALELVKTPYVMRLDDDMLLTSRSRIHEHLTFLQNHPEVDLCGVQAERNSERASRVYSSIRMRKPLIIPAGTVIDGREVVYKTPNCFLARTEALRKVGYDPNIRMIDHHEFFWRAAGQIVSVQDLHSYVYHCHNWFDWRYRPYRSDYKGDLAYIRAKQMQAIKNNHAAHGQECVHASETHTNGAAS